MAERITRSSCKFCQHEDRDILEQELLNGIVAYKDLDKKMAWREGTSDRHFRNHMGEYHLGSNSECPVCTDSRRAEMEEAYFVNGLPVAAIAAQAECSEELVYRHLKYHLKPIVQASAAPTIAVKAGNEIDTLRRNVERLNGELHLILDEADRNDPAYVRNLTGLHKEVRETVKDILRVQERSMGTDAATSMNAQTINILKVELAKESPEVWRRVRETLLEQEDD